MRSLALVVALGLFLFAGEARAQNAKVDTLKTNADAAMDNLHYAEALDGYKQAYELSHDARFLYNMGRALGALGEYPQAVEMLERFRMDAPADLRARVPQLDQVIGDFKRHVAVLTVQCNVQGAHVLVRAKEIGITPLADLKLTAGPAVVEVNADGYDTQRKEVALPEAGAVTVAFDLIKASPLGTLVIRSTPPATHVLVDGKGFGGTPLETLLVPGPHSLLLSRGGYLDLSTSAVVEKGRTRAIDLRLEKTPSVFTRWWFWTIVGVAVASGVAITIAAFTERPADVGTIPPGQVRGP